MCSIMDAVCHVACSVIFRHGFHNCREVGLMEVSECEALCCVEADFVRGRG